MHCVRYGGFLRDYIFGNRPASDIDGGCEDRERVWKLANDSSALKQAGIKVKAKRDHPHSMVNFRTIEFVYPHPPDGASNQTIDVDVTPRDQSTKGVMRKPKMDCDVNNFMFKVWEFDDSTGWVKVNGGKGFVGPKVDALSGPCPPDEVIARMEKKQFVCVYNLEDTGGAKHFQFGDNGQYRMAKLLKKGWTCLNKLPADVEKRAKANQPNPMGYMQLTSSHLSLIKPEKSDPPNKFTADYLKVLW